MPENKLNPITARNQLRKNPSVTEVAKILNVHPSTISRFVQREGIDLGMIATAQKTGITKVAITLKVLGMKNTHIARRLAVSPAYITQLLT